MAEKSNQKNRVALRGNGEPRQGMQLAKSTQSPNAARGNGQHGRPINFAAIPSATMQFLSSNHSQIKKGSLAGIIILAAIALILLTPCTYAFLNWELFKGWLPVDALTESGFWGTEASACSHIAMDIGWMATCAAALTVGYTAAALAKVLSGPFGPRLAAWSKDTLYNTAKSTVILIFIGSAYMVTRLPSDSFYGTGLLQIESAINYAETVRNTLIYEFTAMTSLTAVLSTVGNITPYFRPNQMIGISFSLSPAFRPIFDALGILLSMMSVAVGEWFVHIWLLCFIKARVLSILLPVGLLFRSMGLNRAGDGLIALCIGLFFIYPFMLNVSSQATLLYLQSEFGSSSIVQASDGNTFKDYRACFDHSSAQGKSLICFFKLMGGSSLQYTISSLDQVLGDLSIAFVVQLLTGSFVVTFIIGLMVFFIFNLFKATAFYVLVVSILMPLFNIFITFTAMKEIAAFLGTQLDFSAFEKIF